VVADGDLSARTAPASDDCGQFVGVVESSLARALQLAAEQGQWQVVTQLATELEARREARSGSAQGGEVVSINRTKRA
jgi:hypothetical protein